MLMAGAEPHGAAVDVRERVAARYERFAAFEARGRSPLYERVASAIARDRAVLVYLAGMPEPKWQPSLLLAAVRYLYGTPDDAGGFIDLVRAHGAEIADVMAARSTKTNEPARCATLLPVLARLPQPLALLEVGASAGLCLLPDRYAFDYGHGRVEPGERLHAVQHLPHHGLWTVAGLLALLERGAECRAVVRVHVLAGSLGCLEPGAADPECLRVGLGERAFDELAEPVDDGRPPHAAASRPRRWWR